MTPRTAALFLLAVSNPGLMSAQGVVATPPRPAPSAVLWRHARADFRSQGSHEPLGGFLGPGDEDHRYTGFFVGAGLAAGLSLMLIGQGALDSDACECNTGSILAAMMVFTTVSGISGAVIGGLISK